MRRSIPIASRSMKACPEGGNRGREKPSGEKTDYSRRDFLRISATTLAGMWVTSGFVDTLMAVEVAGIPPSAGYLLVDVKKCAGCMSCMLACSLAHEGKENLSLSRIQVIQEPFELFPHDISLSQCRQCVQPECIKACPTGAAYSDARFGNVRMVDTQKCIGCKACIQACPFRPSRVVWDWQAGSSKKCDLCAGAPHWGAKGGPDGKQACVSVCPMGAIRLTRQAPLQAGDAGYNVNLRGEGWKSLGYPVD
jgi:protein NrfC